MSRQAARIIAFHLPQFHPIPENDDWWGEGFTEWTNTAKARPLFPGHYQPHVPGALGFYDLRLPESREAQATMARQYGVEGFCYYHYWFGGRRILERPLSEITSSGSPHFPFCVCWANESWTGIWHGVAGQTLIEQTYPGDEDHGAHFETLLPMFRDPRYLRVDGKPVFVVYRGWEVPDAARVWKLWRSMAQEASLGGLHLVAVQSTNFAWQPADDGFDAVIPVLIPPKRPWFSWRTPVRRLRRWWNSVRGRPTVYRYAGVVRQLLRAPVSALPEYPCVLPNWDNTPRSGKNGLVLSGSTPELFGEHVAAALDLCKDVPSERRLVFVKSWNEWAEGNHLEPDLCFGRAYLEALAANVLGPAATDATDDSGHADLHKPNKS